VRLNGTLVAGGDVLAFPRPRITTTNVVVYAADAAQDAYTGLYAVPIDGSSTPLLLNQPLLDPYPSDFSFELTPDGSRAIYRHYADDLYSVPLDGSTPPLLLSTSGENCYGAGFVSPDGLHTVGYCDGFLWSTPSDGSAATVAIADLAIQNSGALVEFTPDGQRVVYTGNYFTGYFSASETGVAWVDGHAPELVLASSFVEFGAWKLFSDSERLLIGQGLELSVRALDDGSADVLATLPSGYSFRWAALTPDESWALFGFATSSIGEATHLARVRTDGSQPAWVFTENWAGVQPPLFTGDGASAVLSTFSALHALDTADWAAPRVTLASLSSSFTIRAEILPGDLDVLFTANLDWSTNAAELYVRPIDASSPALRLDTPGGSTSDDGVISFSAASGGSRAVYLDRDGADPIQRLFGVPVDLAVPTSTYHGRLASGLPVLGDVTEALTSADGRVALYRADIENDERFELVAVRPFDPHGPRRLNPTLATSEDVDVAFALDPSGTLAACWVVGGSTSESLWCARTDGSSAALQLDTVNFPGQATAPLLTPGGQFVLYETGATGLASARTDGSTAPIALAPAGLDVSVFQLDAGGTTVLFLGTASGVDGLYSAPADGSAPAVRLVPAAASTVDLIDTRLVGGTAYFRADIVNNAFELDRVPLDGSAGPTRLSGPLVAGGSVTDFDVRAGNAVYRADEDVDGRFELYRVVSPGTSLALTAMPSDGDVQTDLALTPDGGTVVFRADPAIDARLDLLAVASDGSAPPITLAAPPFATRDVLHFAMDAAGDALVYGMNNGFAAPAFELHRVDIAGGNDHLLSDRAREYLVTNDGFAVFATAFWPEKLMAARLAGGAPELLAEMAPDPDGEVLSFQSTRNGRVFFVGRREDPAISELFLTFTSRPRREGGAPGNGGTIVR
jgi:hypothetical protein